MEGNNKSYMECEVFSLVRHSLSWEYYGGSHDYPLLHSTTHWRLLPFLVLVCTVEGEYECEIEGLGLRRILRGEALLVPAGTRHTVAMPRQGTVHHAHIQFSIFNSMDVLQFFDVPWVVKGIPAKEIAWTTAELHKVMSEQSGPMLMNHVTGAQFLSISLLNRIVSVSKPRGVDLNHLVDIQRIEPVFRHIEKNLSRPMDRAELAKLVFLSETHFHQVFTKVMKVSPMTYVRNVKMRKAQQLLTQSNLRIAEVGERIGYPDIFHFSKVFKSELGISPKCYREKMRKWFADGHA